MRATALKALWQLSQRDVVPFIEEMVVDLNREVRISVAWVLGEIGHGQDQFKQLLVLLEKDPDRGVKRMAERAWRRIKMKEDGVRILLAGSDLPLCRRISYQLSVEGYLTEIAVNGEDALEVAAESKPHVVVVDIRLPGINGIEVARRIREMKWADDTTVIACTDIDSHPLVNRAIKAGANSYIVEPCTFDKIQDKLRYYL